MIMPHCFSSQFVLNGVILKVASLGLKHCFVLEHFLNHKKVHILYILNIIQEIEKDSISTFCDNQIKRLLLL